MAFGEIVAKQSQDDKPLTHQRLVRTASVSMAFGADRRFTVVAREKSAQLGRCFRGCLPPRSSPLGLSDSDRRFDEALLVAPTSFRMRTIAPAVDQPATAEPRYHTKRLIASLPRVGYMSRAAASDAAVVARHFEPRCAANPHRGFCALRPLPNNFTPTPGATA